MRGILVLCALLAVGLAGSGCGGGDPAPWQRILFVHDPDATAGTPWGNGDLYVRQRGGRPRRLTTSSAAGAPRWSPDGTQVAFTMAGCPAEADSECASFVEVYVAQSDGSEQRQLTLSAASELRSGAPSWSPDGRRIAFVREVDTYSKLAVVSVASGKTTFLRASGFPRRPAWGRRRIAYLEPRSRSRPYDLTIRIADPTTGRSWRSAWRSTRRRAG